jgi:hypothetical protein
VRRLQGGGAGWFVRDDKILELGQVFTRFFLDDLVKVQKVRNFAEVTFRRVV